MFGSFSNGFKTGTSDLDVVFIGNMESDSAHSVLGQFGSRLADLGFENVTKIFQANVPLLKLSDRKSDMEVDFCINNELGVRNSMLLKTYCQCDDRVLQLGRLVKDWAKRHELVGTADGCLNSYAYMLLVIYFLQSVQPAVVPNLQGMEFESKPVSDRKWGDTDVWETGFFENVSSLPKPTNEMPLGELLIRFYHFYARVFDWQSHAVCPRLHRTGTNVDKFTLKLPTNDDQWYLEDPFDLKHNLAGKCSRAGKKHILEEMNSTFMTLSTSGSWSASLPSNPLTDYFMKCRISQAVTPQALLEEFEEFDLVKLHFPKPDGNARMPTAFLQFPDSTCRRRAHTKNEKYIADCQLQLHYSTQHSLAEAVTQSTFSTYEMASYKMQRQVLAARVQGMSGQDSMAAAPGLTQQQTLQNVSGYKDLSADAVSYNYNQRAMPQAQLPQQPSGMLWPQDQGMQMQMQQMQQQQLQKVEPMRNSGGLAYGPNQNEATNNPWQQHQMWQQMQQPQPQQLQQPQMLQQAQLTAVPIQTQRPPPPPPPPQQAAAVPAVTKKSTAEKEAEKQEKKAAKAKAKAEAKAAQAQAAKQKAAALPSGVTKQTASSGVGWLDVRISNHMQPEKGLVLNPELADKLVKLNDYFSKFESVDHRTKHSEVRLEIELKDGRATEKGKKLPLFTVEQWEVMSSFHERLKNKNEA